MNIKRLANIEIRAIDRHREEMIGTALVPARNGQNQWVEIKNGAEVRGQVRVHITFNDGGPSDEEALE